MKAHIGGSSTLHSECGRGVDVAMTIYDLRTKPVGVLRDYMNGRELCKNCRKYVDGYVFWKRKLDPSIEVITEKLEQLSEAA